MRSLHSSLTTNANLVAPFERYPPSGLSPSLNKRQSLETSIFSSRLTTSSRFPCLSIVIVVFWKSYWSYAIWGSVRTVDNNFRGRNELVYSVAVEIPIKAPQVSILDTTALNDDILPDAFRFALGFEDAWPLERCVDGWCMELADSRRTELKSASSSRIFTQISKVKRIAVIRPYWLRLVCKNTESESSFLDVSLRYLGIGLKPIEHGFHATKDMFFCWFKIINWLRRLVYSKQNTRNT